VTICRTSSSQVHLQIYLDLDPWVSQFIWPDSDLWEYLYTSTCTHRSNACEEPGTHRYTQ
jgi:hypothetical protein